MFFASVLMAIGNGLCLAVQSPTNSNLSKRIGHFQATVTNFTVGSLLGLLLTVIHRILTGSGSFLKVTEAFPWQLLGGAYGITIVLIITFSAPVLGIALMLTQMMLGQLVMGTLVDALGLFNVQAVAIRPLRIFGIIVVGLGIVLVYIGKVKQGQKEERTSRSGIFALLAFFAGCLLAIQAPTNAALAKHTGSLEASLINFLVGLVLIFIITMIISKGRLNPVKGSGATPWMFFGGLYGAFSVLFNVVATPYLGVTLLMAGSMLGQLVGGMVVDSFGLLRMPKIRMNGWRYSGVALIALGVVLVTIARML